MRIFCFSVLALVLAESSQAGQISGRVVDEADQPIPWIFLDVYDADGNYFDYSYTDDNGVYAIPNLGLGTFYVRTYTLGTHVDEWYDDVAGAAESLIHDPVGAGATPVEVPLFQTVQGIDFALAAAATITGRVTRAGSGNAPVTNIYVDAYLADGTRFQGGFTDQSGTYAIEGLPAGAYSVRTDAGSRGVDTWQDGTIAFNAISPTEANAPALTLAAGQVKNGVDFSLAVPGTLGGTLQHGDGSPVHGVYVDLYDATGSRLEFTRSTEDGIYLLTGLPAGTYLLGTDSLESYIDLWYNQRLVVNPDDPVSDLADAISLAATEVRTNLQFVLTEGASLTGRVTDELDAGIADVFVDAFLDGIFLDFAVTGPDGRFVLAALPDGDYALKVDTGGRYRNEWYPDQPVFDVDDPAADGAGTITLTNGISVSNLVFELSPGADIAGTVTAVAGGPIADVYLDLYDAQGRRLFYSRSASNGAFRLGGLPAGAYYLGTDSQDRYVDEWHQDTVLFTPINPVADGAEAIVLADTTSLTNLVIDLRVGGSITGTIVGPSNAPIDACYIDVYRGTNYFDWTFTDSNGVYRIDTLPAGTWYLRTDNLRELVNEWYGDAYIFHRGQPELDGASPIFLAEDEMVEDVDLALGLGADLEGQVQTLAGSPLSGVVIDFYDVAGRYYDFAVTDENGNYHLELMPPGTWYVGSETFGDYLDRWFRATLRDFYNDPIGDGATPVGLEDGTVLIGIDLVLGLPPEAQCTLAPTEPGLVEWLGRSNQTYRVQRNLDLPGGVWFDAPSGATELEKSYKPAGDEGLRRYLDPSPPPGGACYRITNQ